MITDERADELIAKDELTDAERAELAELFDDYVPGVCASCDYDRGRGLWYSPCPHGHDRAVDPW